MGRLKSLVRNCQVSQGRAWLHLPFLLVVREGARVLTLCVYGGSIPPLFLPAVPDLFPWS